MRLLKILLAFSLLLVGASINSIDMEANKPKIHYVFDPLCGWCYGFEPVMIKIQTEFKDTFDFNVISGGMVPKSNAEPIRHMREFLEGAIPRLEETTGIKIGKPYYDNILYNDSVVLDSELPTKAYLLLKDNYKGREVELAKKIQDLLYQDGLDLSKKENFYGLFSDSNYITKLESPELELEMKEMFQTSTKMGVRGYPALLFEYQGKVSLISSGYVSYEALSKALKGE